MALPNHEHATQTDQAPRKTKRPLVFNFYYYISEDGVRHTFSGKTIQPSRAEHRKTANLAPWEQCTDCELVHQMEVQLDQERL